MSKYSDYYKARNILSEILFRDFIGPVFDEECLLEPPINYYIMGKLYPQSNTSEILDLARDPLLENEVETYDASISLVSQRNPSCMAVTAVLNPGVFRVKVSGSYAFYRQIPFQEATQHGIDISKWERLQLKPDDLWRRDAQSFSEIIDFSERRLENRNLEGNLQLQVYTHTVMKTGERVITVALVNENRLQDDDSQGLSAFCVFQPVLRVEGIDGETIFTSVNRQTYLTEDKELLELEMLYSDVCCYAQGHGCSVTWDREHSIPQWVESTFFPEYNLLQMKAADIEAGDVLKMKYLAESQPDDILSQLKMFADKYKGWIEEQKSKILKFQGKLKDVANQNIGKCQNAYNRIMSAVQLLSASYNSDGKAFKAFQLANKAMLMQRRQSVLKNNGEFDPDKAAWYPFQLAFILHELSSFIEPSGSPDQEVPDREMVDLLWFPTGGGKTEAYLGISAFVIFLRRLRDPNADGVTVIMRYTLRLLTLQQFERASILICACELLRRKYNLGGSEISIGLWVGDSLIPNSLKDARASINKQQRGGIVEASNPLQIRVCPWCGKRLTAKNYSVDIDSKRMKIKCENRSCSLSDFQEGLPIHLVDEAIYEHLPSFLVATVDKFAQLPLNDKPAAFFGHDKRKKLPPELIIQDELHLISGPLGTMTGIYEAAITKLCEKDDIHAKVIASTATIRNASEQIKSLYGRGHTQFPPQGITAEDSFFAVRSDENDKPAREYFGVMGVGVSATTALIRVNAALLFATRYLATIGLPDRVVDNFWTITGYFNSLRELGGTNTQILDDVQSRFVYLARTKFAEKYPGVDTSKDYTHTEELTSRMSNSEIADVIQVKLKRAYTAEDHADVYDFLLASNMISVGVDVGRLGAMVVAGQPKTNAEYIQATSRVGRDNPGIVITVYNGFRSRDRSHYEQFLKYHSALYRYVEATSVTPFSDRARDRGLHALYVTLCRYLIKGLRKNDQAGKYQSSDSEVKKVRKKIEAYVKEVDKNESLAVSNELDDIEKEWEFQTEKDLVYRDFNNKNGLLKPDTQNDRFRTMNSMRNVDGQSGIYLLRGE